MVYLLQLKNWFDEWEDEDLFDDAESAIIFGEEKFPQNEWRVKRLLPSGETDICYLYDSLKNISDSAESEIARFRSFDRFVERLHAHQQREDNRRRQRRTHQRRIRTASRILERLWDNVGFARLNEDAPASKVNWKDEGF